MFYIWIVLESEDRRWTRKFDFPPNEKAKKKLPVGELFSYYWRKG